MIKIYTDGACTGNPGPGGWGAIIMGIEGKVEIHGGDRDTTNNRMEMTAVIEALKNINQQSDCHLTVFTDSTYVLKGMTEWIAGWKKNNWISSTKKPVKNKDLWLILDLLVSKYDIDWVWVKGHSGHPENERADSLANIGVDELLQQ